jgi:hypothetical protein
MGGIFSNNYSNNYSNNIINNIINNNNNNNSNNSESSLFVFYYIVNEANWTYPKLYKTWWWVGSGSTSNKLYPNEEQFQGDKIYLKRMKKMLTKKFTKLKKDNKVLRYKIRLSYLP